MEREHGKKYMKQIFETRETVVNRTRRSYEEMASLHRGSRYNKEGKPKVLGTRNGNKVQDLFIKIYYNNKFKKQ